MAHGLAQRAFADDGQRAAIEIVKRVARQAESGGFLPGAGHQIGAVGQQLAPQRQHQHQCMFGYSDQCIIADIANGNAVRLAGGDVDVVVTGGGNGDQLEFGRVLQDVCVDHHLN